MVAKDFQEVFTRILDREVLDVFSRDSKIQERERKKDVQLLLRSMVMAAANGDGGHQASVMRLYLEEGGTPLGRSGFYRWFDNRLAQVMQLISQNALAVARLEEIDLPGYPSKYVDDWHIFDSTTVKVDNNLFGTYPGVGDYAAIKIHKRMSLGRGTVVDYHFSPAREYDSQHLSIDASMRGLGILVDLGYASFDTIAKCQKHGVQYVMRLKDGWKPRVKEIHRGEISKAMKIKSDFELLVKESLKVDGRTIDISVEMGRGSSSVDARVVGVPTATKSYRFYITRGRPVS